MTMQPKMNIDHESRVAKLRRVLPRTRGAPQRAGRALAAGRVRSATSSRRRRWFRARCSDLRMKWLWILWPWQLWRRSCRTAWPKGTLPRARSKEVSAVAGVGEGPGLDPGVRVEALGDRRGDRAEFDAGHHLIGQPDAWQTRKPSSARGWRIAARPRS